MAHAITVTTLMDTSNMAKLHVYIDGDSSDSSEITTADTDVIFDASALKGANNAGRILEIRGALDGFNVQLDYDGNTPFPAVVLPADSDFRFKLGDIPGNQASTPNGDIVMSTLGLASSNAEGWFTILVRKAD
jgi:hypothetical protein